jgi:hypothetical protein
LKPRGNRASIAGLTSSVSRITSDRVIRIDRSLLPSRAARDAMDLALFFMARRSRAIRASSVERRPSSQAWGADDDLLRSAARRDARAAGFGKPYELSARDGARIIVGEGARDKVHCDFVMGACRQDEKGGAPVQ